MATPKIISDSDRMILSMSIDFWKLTVFLFLISINNKTCIFNLKSTHKSCGVLENNFEPVFEGGLSLVILMDPAET